MAFRGGHARRHGGPKARSGLLVVGLLLGTPFVHADVVERRGAEPAVEGTVTLIDDAGVEVRSPLGAVHFIPWDRVRSVQADRVDPTLDAVGPQGPPGPDGPTCSQINHDLAKTGNTM